MNRWALDQYRPYVIMMNARARASFALREHPETGIEKAVIFIGSGIEGIVEFHKEYGLTSEMENSLELSILKTLKTEFLRNIPESLEDQLAKAINEERFEDAVELRDRIQSKHKKN